MNKISQFRPGDQFDGTFNPDGSITIYSITLADGTVLGQMPPKDPDAPKVVVQDLPDSKFIGPKTVVQDLGPGLCVTVQEHRPTDEDIGPAIIVEKP